MGFPLVGLFYDDASSSLKHQKHTTDHRRHASGLPRSHQVKPIWRGRSGARAVRFHCLVVWKMLINGGRGVRSLTRISIPRSGAELRFYSRGGRHRRAAHWAVLSVAWGDSPENPTSKIRSHTRERRKSRPTSAIQQKIAHVELSAPHDGAQLKRAGSEEAGSHARAAARAALRAGGGSNGFGGVIRTS